MPVPALPPEGSTSWYTYASGLHDAVVTDLPAADTTLQGLITTLQGQVTTLQSQVATLQSQVTTLQAGKADLVNGKLDLQQIPTVNQLLFLDQTTAATTALTYTNTRFVKVDQ